VRLDLIAGLSLAAFVIPESLAYASMAQLSPVTGLYCYLVAGIAYAIRARKSQSDRRGTRPRPDRGPPKH